MGFSWPLVGAGVALTVAGEVLRLWGVHHIGVVSRTRSDRLGPLVSSGPFALVRNPLYIGNVLIWLGFALTARLVWLAPIVLVLLGAEYHAIVRWEEQLLGARMGDAYSAYLARVPRWIPRLNAEQVVIRSRSGSDQIRIRSGSDGSAWTDTLFSERGTLIAIVLGYLLLWTKARF